MDSEADRRRVLHVNGCEEVFKLLWMDHRAEVALGTLPLQPRGRCDMWFNMLESYWGRADGNNINDACSTIPNGLATGRRLADCTGVSLAALPRLQ